MINTQEYSRLAHASFKKRKTILAANDSTYKKKTIKTLPSYINDSVVFKIIYLHNISWAIMYLADSDGMLEEPSFDIKGSFLTRLFCVRLFVTLLYVC